jgi:hypothetical protein
LLCHGQRIIETGTPRLQIEERDVFMKMEEMCDVARGRGPSEV